MKNALVEYYQPTKDEFDSLWRSATFVFDANVLLYLYQYSHLTAEDLLGILREPEIKRRVWIPYQFAREYQQKRISVVSRQKESYQGLIAAIRKVCQQYEPHPFLDMEEILSAVTVKIEDQEKKHPTWDKTDIILENLSAIFEGKVGKPLPETERAKVLSDEGPQRYAKKIPPGYKDASKQSDSQYNDLIGWFEIIDFAKEEKTPIIFITDDAKEDWWWKVNGMIMGPRPELRKEIRTKAGVEMHMYDSKGFVKHASKFLKKVAREETLQEIEEIRRHIEEALNAISASDFGNTNATDGTGDSSQSIPKESTGDGGIAASSQLQ